MTENPSVVILTAVDVGYEEVYAALSRVRAQVHPASTRFVLGCIGATGPLVALALTGKDNPHARTLTERAITYFSPVAVIFVGVAGARRGDVALGDAVIATHVYAYRAATSKHDGTRARPRVRETAHSVDQTARHVARDRAWVGRLPADQSPDGSPPPRVHFGPIAAGEIAHYSAVSDARQWLREHYSDAIAVEMEAAGVAQAGHHNNALPTIMVRGISDYADMSKSATDDAGWQPRAVANAAAFAAALAVALATELGMGNTPSRTGATRGRGGPFNLAMPNSHVGVQGEHVTVHGGIHLGGPDPSSGAAAVETSGPAIRSDWRGRALTWVREAFRGITELAAGVATIMTAARSVM